MPRLLFIPFFVLILFSCADDKNKTDEADLVLTEADSIRCLDETLEGILQEGKENQKRAQQVYEVFHDPNIVECFVIRNTFKILINSSGNLMVNFQFDSTKVSEQVYEYFMFNRNLSGKEMIAASTNSSHPGFVFPFYDRFDANEIEQRIENALKDLQELQESDASDSLKLPHLEFNVEEWKVRKRTLELIDSYYLPQVSPTTMVRFEYQSKSEKYLEVLREIAYAFYEMRNYECLRYFKESYLKLYCRAQKKKLKADQEKLQALRTLHPAVIFTEDWSRNLSDSRIEYPPISPE